jgi:transposase
MRKTERPTRTARLPRNLPEGREVVVPAEAAAAPGEWRRAGEESSDQLEKEPGYFYIKRTVRPKYVRLDNPFAPPVIAPAKKTVIDSGFWGDGLLAEVLTNKYLYHLPLYRQETLYASRSGVSLPRQTMGDAVEKIADMLGALVARMKIYMLAGGYIQADETPVTYLDTTRPGGSSKGYYWVYRGPDGEVIFDWHTTREHKHLTAWLGENFGGVLQSDGYAAYQEYVRARAASKNGGKPKLERASCLAHIRRKFETASGQRPGLTRWFLKVIGKLYRIEQALRDEKADPARRAKIRGRDSRPLVHLLKKAATHLLTKSTSILPKSHLGLALRYALGQWPGLCTYLEHGIVEIDNNLVENAIRPTAVGKKNALFIGSPEAGDRSATIYTVLLSARAQGVDPQAYLQDILGKIPGATTSAGLDALLPAAWAKANPGRKLASVPAGISAASAAVKRAA